MYDQSAPSTLSAAVRAAQAASSQFMASKTWSAAVVLVGCTQESEDSPRVSTAEGQVH